MTSFTIPTIETQRLTLRAPKLEDFEQYAAFLSSDRAQYMHGPMSRKEAWRWFTNDTAHWPLMGFGGLMIEENGTLAGQVAITRGPTFPEPELGWFLLDGFTGRGIAAEAGFALRNWAYETAGLKTLVSYIHPENAASIALAKRLGAELDENAPRPEGETLEETLVYRHPAPDADGGMEAYA